MVAIIIMVTSSSAQQNKSSLPNNTPATLGDIRFVNNRVSAQEKEITELKQRVAALECSKSNTTTTFDDTKFVEVAKKNGFVTYQDGDRRWINMRWNGGVREQIEGKIATTNARVDTIRTASQIMAGMLERHSAWLSQHDSRLARHDTLITELQRHTNVVSNLLSAAFRTEADEDDLNDAESQALARLRQQLGLLVTNVAPNGETVRSVGDRTNQ